MYGTRHNFEKNLTTACESPAYSEKVQKWMECADALDLSCTTAWGEESFDAALHWAYNNTDGSEVQSGSYLDDAYYVTRLPVVKERLMAGGIRLAAVLESLATGGGGSGGSGNAYARHS
mmetsp:Transcript_5216/g.15257  ORF Transcript_5216/g.15257 Transcript_5216/m.15257 type:complete len:119 (+) Transcript_5216:273-629(+)